MGIKERWQRLKPLPEDISEKLSQASALFAQEGILLVYLFGSLATEARGEDVDLAILPGERGMAELRSKLSEFLGTERIDLVNLKTAPPLFRFQVIRNGVLLYATDEEARSDFELSALREYRDTAPLRRRQARTLQERTEKMAVNVEVVVQRLQELSTVLAELSKYQDKTEAEINASLSLRWIIKRGLIAAANLLFDVADHILTRHFGIYPQTYEDSLHLLKEAGVLSPELYQQLKGLGGFRNILVHEYVKIDISELRRGFSTAFQTFPAFSAQIQDWLRRNYGAGF
jgi:uncharacterized protein YutE (UPF0331/DUF86 family)/predicted nucleotidyltransferase